MDLLTSNFEPLSLPKKTFVARWEELFQKSSEIKIGVGYASNDSLLYLKKLIELNQPKRLEMCLGMAYFEGLTRSQFEATSQLDSFLRDSEIGGITVARTFPFHGKVHHFKTNDQNDSFLLGSSNLSNIVPIKGISRRNFEVDLEISDSKLCSQIEELLTRLFRESSSNFQSIEQDLQVKENVNSLLSTRSDVDTVNQGTISKIIEKLTDNTFEIPLKDTPRSNLNAYFGEGRINQQGFVKPRHWYEVEIIVDQIVQQSGSRYPANQDFVAYTDDGHRFLMRSSGDYGKNLRSKDDLTILGRWIKGRMESSGALKSGELLTSSSLSAYGRNTISLTQTSIVEKDSEVGELSVWYMDFGIARRRD